MRNVDPLRKRHRRPGRTTPTGGGSGEPSLGVIADEGRDGTSGLRHLDVAGLGKPGGPVAVDETIGRPPGHGDIEAHPALDRFAIRRTRAAAEFATIEWIDWYNTARLHREFGDIAPLSTKPNGSPLTPRPSWPPPNNPDCIKPGVAHR